MKCIRGHDRTPGKNCKVCAVAANKAWRSRNPGFTRYGGRITDPEVARRFIAALASGLTFTQVTTGRRTHRVRGPINRTWYVCNDEAARNLMAKNPAFKKLVLKYKKPSNRDKARPLGARAMASLRAASRGDERIMSCMVEAKLSGKLLCRDARDRYREFRRQAYREEEFKFGEMRVHSLDYRYEAGGPTVGESVTRDLWK